MYQVRRQIAETNVVGRYDSNDGFLKKLEAQWHHIDCTLVCATDGGLKDGIGTSSYAFFFQQQLTPILAGRAGEYQSAKSASSTR